MQELENLFRRLRGCPFWEVPLYRAEVRGSERLAEFWENVTPLRNRSRALPIPVDQPIAVDSAAEQPAPQMMFFVFAGKGGVGKTTLACATALRLAGQFPGKDVLLFSADPAHSLSACLGVEVGARPTSISPGLTALEIDAQAEFTALKYEYRRELTSFLQSLLPDMDLGYDREVMERILDLSPPGLDEIMALDRIMQFHREGAYDVIVLDAAPTGHLIRLLELPDIIDQWLKVLFGLFLKYKHIFRLPKMAERFVNMSKNLKQLRQLLADHSRSAVYAVSILTDMAFLETQDLIAAAKRMGLSVPVLFLNLATQDRSCALCGALHGREQMLLEKFSEAFPDLHRTLIYRQGDLRGMERLDQLGQALYTSVHLAKAD
jgi:arsenite-transporting ATPase